MSLQNLLQQIYAKIEEDERKFVPSGVSEAKKYCPKIEKLSSTFAKTSIFFLPFAISSFPLLYVYKSR
jgi:hypothetical protein